LRRQQEAGGLWPAGDTNKCVHGQHDYHEFAGEAAKLFDQALPEASHVEAAYAGIAGAGTAWQRWAKGIDLPDMAADSASEPVKDSASVPSALRMPVRPGFFGKLRIRPPKARRLDVRIVKRRPLMLVKRRPQGPVPKTRFSGREIIART
jgi:hypothetical protein